MSDLSKVHPSISIAAPGSERQRSPGSNEHANEAGEISRRALEATAELNMSWASDILAKGGGMSLTDIDNVNKFLQNARIAIQLLREENAQTH
jgi:hypothetical protein